jgi:hypothetical protein
VLESDLRQAYEHMKKMIFENWLEVIESVRTLSHQIEQKNYLLVEHDNTIEHIAHGIAQLHTLHMDYFEQQKDVDSQIAEMKSLVDLE